MEFDENSTSLKPFKNLFFFGFFNLNSWLIALGTPMVIMAGELGASAFQIGLAYSFVFLLLPLQILATSTLHRFGYKRQMIFGWTMRAICIFIPITLAWMRPISPTEIHIYTLLAFVFLFALFRSIGNCAVMPWYYALLPDSIRGKFFSYDQTVYSFSGVLTLIYCASLFNWLKPYDAFLCLYITCACASFLSILFLKRVPDVSKPEPTELKTILSLTPKYCLEKGLFRQYLIFICIFNSVQTALVPLTTYYLQIEAKMELSNIMYLTATQYIGAIVGAQLIGKRVDSVGVKPVFRVSILLNLIILLFWVFYSQGMAQLNKYLYIAFFIFGASTATWATANLKYLPRVCTSKKQALSVSIHSSVVGLIAGLSPVLWGYFVKKQDGSSGIDSIPFSIFFGIAIIISIGLYVYIPRLTSEGRNLPSIEIGSYLVRPYRYMSNLVSIGMIKPEKENRSPKDPK